MEKIFYLNREIRRHDGDVVIYGTSPRAVLLFDMLLNNEVYVKCFCDMKSDYYDAKIMNKPCIELEKLRELDNPIVLLDVSDKGKICHLLEHGFSEDAIYMDDYNKYFR